jgi:hypothetical protein
MCSSETSVETQRAKRRHFQKTLLLAGFGWTYFFHPEDGGDMFLRNVGSKEVATEFKNLRNSWTAPQHYTLAQILSLWR